VSLLATLAAWTCLGTLALSGLVHSLKPGRLMLALREQGLLPDAIQRPIAFGVVGLEVGIGVGGLAGVTLASATGPTGTLALISAAALYFCFASYGLFLLLRHSGAPCGCSPGDHPVNEWVVFRAGTLGIAAALCLLADDRILTPSSPAEDLVFAGLAAVAFGATLWSLPAAMHDPSRAASPATATVLGL
jgi:hypothetical protein